MIVPGQQQNYDIHDSKDFIYVSNQSLTCCVLFLKPHVLIPFRLWEWFPVRVRHAATLPASHRH